MQHTTKKTVVTEKVMRGVVVGVGGMDGNSAA